MSKLRPNTEGKVKLSLTLSLVAYSIIVSILKHTVMPLIIMSSASMGDILLMANRGALTGKKENTFRRGVMAFALSHMLYALRMTTPYSEILLVIILVLLLVLTIISEFAKEATDVHICVIYAAILILNAINAFNFNIIAAVGMSLFLVSDAILAICKVVGKRNLAGQIAIWGTYVPAQICMLTAILL